MNKQSLPLNQTQTNPVPSQSDNLHISKNFLFKWLTLLIIIVFFTGGTYLLLQLQRKQTPQGFPAKQISPSQPSSAPAIDETANWKTYTNTKYGYELKYPLNYNLGSCQSCSDLTTTDYITLNDPNFSSQTQGYGTIRISFINQPVSQVTTLPKENLSNQIPAYTETKQSFGYATKYVYFVSSNKVIETTFTGGGSPANKDIPLDQLKNKSVFDKILSTFNFIDFSTKQTNLKTYTNKNLNFLFKYPADYFKFQQESETGIYLAPSAGHGGNGPKFLDSGNVWLEVRIEPNVNVTSYDEFLNAKENQDFYKNAQKVPVGFGFAGGYSGDKLTYSYPAVAGDVRIYVYEGLVLKYENSFSKSGKIYKITLSAWDQETLRKFEKTFNQIVSSFYFLDVVESLKTTTGRIEYVSNSGNQPDFNFNYYLINSDGFPVNDMSGQGQKVTKIPLAIEPDSVNKAQIQKDVGKTVTIKGNFSYYTEAPVLEVYSVKE